MSTRGSDSNLRTAVNLEIELQPTGDVTRHSPPITHQVGESDAQELKPVDRGADAWRVLIAAFIFEALFWGFPTSFGIFQAYYTSLPQFADQTDNVAVIGTLAQGLYYLGAPFAAAMTKRFPQYRMHMLFFGWPLSVLGLLCASFADTVASLVVTQGLAYGIGFLIFTYPILQMVSEWWVTRRGMAFGLISAASGLTGTFMPFILEKLLYRYGYRITLRACAVAMVVLTAPLIPLLKSRLPPTGVGASRSPGTTWSFLREPLFWIYATATLVQGFGFFLPPFFIPSYTIDIGYSSVSAAMLLAVMATAQTFGQFALGWLSDTKLPVSLLTSICCAVAAAATATLWGLGKSLIMLTLYSIMYGFFAFGFGTLRVAMGRAVTADQSAVLVTYSTFVFLQGIGNILTGPIAGQLLRGDYNLKTYGAARYENMIVFVAASSAISALVIATPYSFKRCMRRG